MSLASGQALTHTQHLVVRQTKEWGEILTGFETRNKYTVQDDAGQTLFLAVELSGGLLATLLRLWLKAARPFTMQILDPAGQLVLQLTRPFRFIFHRLQIDDAGGRSLGAVQKRWSWVRRIYDIEDGHGRAVLRLFGPLLHPWTFEIHKDGRLAGKITKKWSGLLKEALTDADNFGVELGPELRAEERTLLLAAVFLIDFVHFENRNN